MIQWINGKARRAEKWITLIICIMFGKCIADGFQLCIMKPSSCQWDDPHECGKAPIFSIWEYFPVTLCKCNTNINLWCLVYLVNQKYYFLRWGLNMMQAEMVSIVTLQKTRRMREGKSWAGVAWRGTSITVP